MSKYRVRSALLLCCLLALADLSQAVSKVKIRGYITARPDANTLMILDDSIQLSSSTHFDLQNSGAAGAKPLSLAELSFGTLIEAEGTAWNHFRRDNCRQASAACAERNSGSSLPAVDGTSRSRRRSPPPVAETRSGSARGDSSCFPDRENKNCARAKVPPQHIFGCGDAAPPSEV